MIRKFAIGIPTLNRADLLQASLDKYAIDFSDVEIFVIDNGNQELYSSDNSIIINEKRNLGVAASWNKLCQLIFKNYDYAMILNDDIYCGYNADVVENAIFKMKSGLVQSQVSWSVFVISKRLYNFVGKFDEIFYPAYYEDSDYLYRMKLKGIIQDVDATLNPKIKRISSTYELAPDLVNNAMQQNRLRYISKWGNSPLLETFITPYGLKKL